MDLLRCFSQYKVNLLLRVNCAVPRVPYVPCHVPCHVPFRVPFHFNKHREVDGSLPPGFLTDHIRGPGQDDLNNQAISLRVCLLFAIEIEASPHDLAMHPPDSDMCLRLPDSQTVFSLHSAPSEQPKAVMAGANNRAGRRGRPQYCQGVRVPAWWRRSSCPPPKERRAVTDTPAGSTLS